MPSPFPFRAECPVGGREGCAHWLLGLGSNLINKHSSRCLDSRQLGISCRGVVTAIYLTYYYGATSNPGHLTFYVLPCLVPWAVLVVVAFLFGQIYIVYEELWQVLYVRETFTCCSCRPDGIPQSSSMGWKNRPGNQFASLPPDQSDLGNINDGPPHLNTTRLWLNDEFFSSVL